MSQDEHPDEISGQEPPDEGFGLLQGSIPWARRLTPRAKVLRIAALFGLALVTVGIVAGSALIAQFFPQAGGAKTSAGFSGHDDALPFPTFPAVSMHATLPTSAYTTPISLIHVAPGYSSNAFLSSAWVCWVTEPLVRSPGSASLLHVARTLDGGQSWREVTPPVTSASGCQIAADHEAFSSVLLVADVGDSGTGPCSTQLLLTQDDGDSWSAIPPPQEYASDCAAEYSLFGDTVFASAGEDPTTQPPRPVEIWRVSASSAWATASAGSGLIVTAMSGQRLSGKLLGVAAYADPHSGPGSVVESADGGATWSQIGALPGATATLYVDERAPGAHAAADPVYAISLKSQTAQSSPVRTLWRWNDERRQWAALPDIPRLANVPDPLAQPDTTVVGVGPDGGLLVSAPITASMNEEPASRTFWYWEDTAQRWIRNEAASAPGVYLYGLGWSGNAATLWLIYLHLGVPPHLEMFTTRFTPDLFDSR